MPPARPCSGWWAPADTAGISLHSLNILGDFNLAGEIWIIRDYFKRMGIEVVANITGDGRVGDIRRAHGAALNVVQCSGATMDLAKMMQERYGTPLIRVSYFGVEDMAESFYDVARFFKDPEMMARTQELVREELTVLYPQLQKYREALTGKKAAIYVGGAFKAFSLVKAFRLLNMQVVLVGSQTGTEEDYRELEEVTDDGTIIVDDSNPLELTSFLKEKEVDIFVGGVKERPIAYKLGVGFCDHNHERKEPLEGFVGMLNFAREVYNTVMSPVWRFLPRRTQPVTLTGLTVGAGLRPSPYEDSALLYALEITSGAKSMKKNTSRALCFHHQRLQALHAVGRLPGISGRGRRRAIPPRLPGLCHLYAALYHQPFPGAHGHRLLVFGGKACHLWRRAQLKAGLAECHEQIWSGAHRGGYHLPHRNHR